MFSNAESINFRGKEVKKIVRLRDNAILYQMDDNHLEFTFTKKQLYLRGLTGSNMIIDYGNGDIRETTGELIQYNYNTLEDETHIVKIYGVTGLGYESFKECHGLTDMTIPSTVTSIGEYCFTDCDHLENINIPSSMTSLPRGCFIYCTGLLSIDIPSSITSIGGSCFYSCSSLVSIDIPSSITSIGGSCFYGCISLEEINLNWTTLEDIVSYQSNWITRANANLKFIIPEGTTDLYIEKGYPSDKLVEISEDETIDVSVSVSYRNDSNNQDGNRPTEIPIELIVSGTIVIRTATLTPENNWSYTFSDLEDGISYQLSASEIDFYDLDITKNNNDFTITADYLPPLTNATVQVTFDDVIPDYRPQSITATLNNGTGVTLTNNNGWSANISNLPAVINHETATYDWTIAQVPHYEIFQKTKNGNVTNFILKQLDNIPASITLERTDGEQILSYVDRQTLPVMTEFCELTATVIDENSNPLSNAYIDFYKNDELWIDHISTDSNGQVTIPYYSEGVGDVEIYAKIGDLVTETIDIEDYWKYDSNTYNTQNNSILQSLPSNFECSFIMRSNGASSLNTAVLVTTTNGSEFYIGKTGSSSTFGTLYPTSSTSQAKNLPNNTIPNNTDVEFIWKYENGMHTLSDKNGHSVSLSGFTPSNLVCSATSNCIIKNIKVKPIQSINISVDNPILSYVDGDTATLTATLDPIASDKTVQIYKDDVLIATKTTDNQGQVSYEYESQGNGDVEFEFKCGLLTKNYTIEDCNCYSATEYSSERPMLIPLPNQFKLEFDIKPTNRSTSSDGNNGYIRIGEDSNNGVWVGQMTSGGYHGIISKPSSTATYCPTITNLDWNHIIVIFDGETVSYTCNNETVTTSASNLTKINGLVTTSYEHLKNIKVKPLQSINIDVDNPILSYAYSTQANPQTATLIATVNPIENGKTVQIFKNDVFVATEQTNNQGQVSYEYTSQGSGDVEFEFKCGLVTETFTIEDCKYFNDGSSINNMNINNGVICTSNGEYITITTSTNGEKYVTIPIGATGDWEYSFEVAELGMINSYGWMINNNNMYGAITETTNAGYAHLTSQSIQFSTDESAKGTIFRLRYENGILSAISNSTVITTRNLSFSLNNFGFYTNQNRIQKIKNIKLKLL